MMTPAVIVATMDLLKRYAGASVGPGPNMVTIPNIKPLQISVVELSNGQHMRWTSDEGSEGFGLSPELFPFDQQMKAVVEKIKPYAQLQDELTTVIKKGVDHTLWNFTHPDVLALSQTFRNPKREALREIKLSAVSFADEAARAPLNFDRTFDVRLDNLPADFLSDKSVTSRLVASILSPSPMSNHYSSTNIQRRWFTVFISCQVNSPAKVSTIVEAAKRAGTGKFSLVLKDFGRVTVGPA